MSIDDDATTARAALLQALQGSGLSLRPQPDGTLQAHADKLELRQVALQSPFGSVDAATVTLTDVVARLGAGPDGTALALRSLSVAELRVDNAELLPARPAAATAPRLEPLGTVQGRLQVAIRDAAWIIDAQITIPVVAGRIDFDRVVVEHVGPNSSMGIAREGVYVEAPNRDRTALLRLASPAIPGVRYEQRGGFANLRITDRGSIDLRAFAEALLGAERGAAPWQPPDREVQAMLDRTKLTGELQLADGILGTDTAHVVLAGRSDGKNGIALDAAVLGQRMVVHWPQLAASGASFEWLGLAGRTGDIAASVDAHVTGSSGSAPQIAVKVLRLTARDLTLS
jgi:hypothetical protein